MEREAEAQREEEGSPGHLPEALDHILPVVGSPWKILSTE